MRSLLTTIRQACSAQIWSQGVELSRKKTILCANLKADELDIKVWTDRAQPGFLVNLWPEENDWTCNCSSKEEICIHVAAAVIACNQAKLAGENSLGEQAQQRMHVLYWLTSPNIPNASEMLLNFERLICPVDFKIPWGSSEAQHHIEPYFLRKTLQHALESSNNLLLAEDNDWQIELLLTTQRYGRLPAFLWTKIFSILQEYQQNAPADPARIFYQSKKVAVHQPRCGLLAQIRPQTRGFEVIIKQDPHLKVIFNNGVLLYDDGLSAMDPIALPTEELQSYRQGKFFPRHLQSHFLADILPKLQSMMPVDSQDQDLQEAQRMPLSIWIESDCFDERDLLLTPYLAYGKPPVAKIQHDQVIAIQANAVPLRLLQEEEKLSQKFTQKTSLRINESHRYRGDFAVEILERLSSLGYMVQGRAQEKFRRRGELSAEVICDKDGKYQLHFQLHESSSQSASKTPSKASLTVSAEDVLHAWQNHQSLVPLLDGGMATLPEDFLYKHASRILALLDSKHENNGKNKAAQPLQKQDLAWAYLIKDSNSFAPPHLETLLSFLGQGAQALPEAQLPNNLQATLRYYQKEGIAWLQWLRRCQWGALLADDMGLGKTLQAICAIEGKTLIVCPTSLLHNWQREILRFRPDLKTNIYHGDKRALAAEDEVILTSYALLRLDLKNLLTPPQSQGAWDLVILDEAQTIKNPHSQVAQAACALPSQHRIALSGTPIENKLEELWSLMHFLNAGLLGELSDFQETFAKPITLGNTALAQNLQQQIAPYMLRRTKEEVAKELPPRTEITMYCQLDKEEQAAYDAVLAASLPQVLEELQEGRTGLDVFSLLLRLRQACCHRGLLPGQHAVSSSKIEKLLASLEICLAANHKALIFSQWTSFLDKIEPHLQEASISFARIDGSTGHRQEIVDTFQSDNGPKVMLLSLKAAGTGLNLTAADHVYLMDPWWNPATENQAADRAHRIGQKNTVFIHYLVAENTIEERIMSLKEQKKQLANLAMVEGQSLHLSQEDWLQLLKP